MANSSDILKAFRSELNGKRDAKATTLAVLLDNPTSIPEHVDIMSEVDKLVGELADIQDKIEMTDFLLKSKEAQ